MRTPTTLMQARTVLTCLWAGSFLLLLAMPMIPLARSAIEADSTLVKWLDNLSATYVAQLGIVLAYHFAAKQNAQDRKPLKIRLPFYLALAMSIAWNGVVLALVAPILWDAANLDTVGATIQTVGSRLAWLTAPALGYFYGKSS